MEPLRSQRMALITLLLPCLLFISYSAMGVLAQNCAYTIYVQTGTVKYAGTDSKITLNIYDEKGEGVTLKNLAGLGIMGSNRNYFQNGNLDIFSGTAKCLPSPVCKMNVTSDGTGPFPGWYLNYIEVVTIKPGVLCYHQKFLINRWLAVDEPPNTLWASKDYCPGFTQAPDHGVIREITM